jgi:DNA-3-methyladenine glycosylase
LFRPSRDFFARPTVTVARDLVGFHLVRMVDFQLLVGVIVETEAYTPDDPASHSYRGMTARNRSMFGPPGHLYVYRIYGVHFCANVVTEAEGTGAAVLLRAVVPRVGLEEMARRRGRATNLADGPGKLCQAFGIDRSHDGIDLIDRASPIWLDGRSRPKPSVIATPRIGITKAVERPWRFVAKTS